MRNRLLRTLAVSLALLPAAAAVAAKPPSTVRDLHYGDVLFYYYQDDYFTAITRLLAARAQQRLPNHADEAELLLGGLKLSYGLHVEAEEIFRRLLDDGTTPAVRNRAWYYLGKMAYQKNLPDAAEQALSRMSADLSPAQRGERSLLIALTRLARNNPAGAADVLQNWQGDDARKGYARYNQAVAQMAANQPQAALATLDGLGRDGGDWDLRDKTNLTLGYALLQRNQPAQAREVLRRVRAQGPFTDRALLGLGWAEVALEQYAAALAPFQQLNQLPLSNAAAQEARLALPYIYGRLGDSIQAASLYRQAIDSFEAERGRLRNAIAAIERGELLAVLLDPHKASMPEGLPGRDYLAEVLATNSFQEALRTYRDLHALRRNLDAWAESIGSFDHMLDARETRFASVLPRAREALAALDMQALTARRQALQSELAQVQQTDDALALASRAERDLWQLADSAHQRIDKLPSVQTTEQRDKARVLRGLLRWQMEQDFPARRWETEKALRDTEAALAELETQRQRLARAEAEADADFASFRDRIETQRQRITRLRPEVATALDDQARRVERLAAAELTRQHALLEQQVSSARFGLARLYDEALRREEIAE